MKSDRRFWPRCPDCYSSRTHLDWSALDNLLRVPGAVLSGMGLDPVVDLRMRCSECGGAFVSSRAGAEAGHWEPITDATAAVAQTNSA